VVGLGSVAGIPATFGAYDHVEWRLIGHLTIPNDVSGCPCGEGESVGDIDVLDHAPRVGALRYSTFQTVCSQCTPPLAHYHMHPGPYTTPLFGYLNRRTFHGMCRIDVLGLCWVEFK
jgi:hypothetical protein